MKSECVICGKLLEEKDCFSYNDERHGLQLVHCLCKNPKCVEAYAEQFDCEPDIDYEEIEQRQQDDLWEQSALFKHPDDL